MLGGFILTINIISANIYNFFSFNIETGAGFKRVARDYIE